MSLYFKSIFNNFINKFKREKRGKSMSSILIKTITNIRKNSKPEVDYTIINDNKMTS